MKKKIRKIKALLLCVAELVIGVLLLIKPDELTAGMIICCGALLAVRGMLDAVSYFKLPAQEAAEKQGLARGLALTITGLFCAFGCRWLMEAMPFQGMVYAVLLLWLGVQKIQTAVNQLRLGAARWYITGGAALLSLIFAAVIFFNPFADAGALWIFAGVALIAAAAADAASFVMNHTKE